MYVPSCILDILNVQETGINMSVFIIIQTMFVDMFLVNTPFTDLDQDLLQIYW